MGAFLGDQLQPREIAGLCHRQGWRDLNLVRIVATCLSESWGYTRAYNDNVRDGKTLSRDVGLFQINIPGSAIGTNRERDLYDPVKNTAAAWQLYNRRWWRKGFLGKRGFQPWYAYTLGWATFPDYWVWSLKQKQWVETGQYLHRAITGVANFYAEQHGVDVPLVYRKKKPPRPGFIPLRPAKYRPVENDGNPA